MTFERQYVVYMCLLAAGYAYGKWERWGDWWERRRRQRLVERLGRERSPW